MKNYSFIVLVLLTSCGIGMAYERKISKGYYLIATDAKEDLGISRELKNGGYIGRIPERVLRYSVVNDTLIFARATKGYYVLNTTHDHDFAETQDVVVGPMDQETFNRDWSSKYRFKFISPK